MSLFVAALVGLMVSFGALMASVSPAEAASCAGSLAAGEIRVVLVVDATDLGGGSSATCLVVAAGTTGSQLLARRGAELGTGSPRYGSSGLLCAIDGQPATGCGESKPGGFAYWAYYTGSSGSWVYGNINPFTRRLSDGDIEGWRFHGLGSGTPQDPPPRIGPSRSLFPPLTTVAPVPAAPSAPATGGESAAPARLGAPTSQDPSTPTEIDAPTSSPSADPIPMASESSVGDGATAEVAAVTLASSTADASTTGRWAGVAAVVVLIAVFGAGAVVRTRRSR